MVRRVRTVALALLVLLALPAGAQSGAAKGRGGQSESAKRASRPARVLATDIEIRIIRDYFVVQTAKPKPLPPGIAKNLARGKPIPPGIARTRMPDDLLRRLPAREGTRWILAGDVLLLVDVGDVIVDVVRAIL